MTDQSPLKKLLWSIENEAPELAEKLRGVLREVKDPELGLDIIQLGLVRDVILSEKSALIKMILTTPFCPYGPALLESTRQKAEEALNLPAHIDLGLEPWDFSMMEEGAAPDWGMYF